MKELFEGLGGSTDAALDALPAPRPAQGAPLRDVRVVAAGAPPFEVGALLVAVRRHWFAGVSVAAVVFAVSAAGVLVRLSPSYAGEALLNVEPIVPRVAYTDEEWRARSIQGFYSDYVRTLVRLARTPEVAAGAVEILRADGVDWLPEGVEVEDAAAHLAARLQVLQVRDTQLVSVRFEDGDPALVAPVANAATGALLETLEAGEARRNAATASTLEREAKRLRMELAEVNGGLDALSEPLGSAMADERHNIFFERIDALQESWAKALLVAAEAESERARAGAEVERLRAGAPEGALEKLVDDDAAVRDARVMLGRLARDEESASGHLSSAHPERAQALERLREATARVASVEEDTRARLRARLVRERSEEAETLTATSEARLVGTQRALERLQLELEGAREAFRGHGRALFEANRLRSESSRIHGALKRLAVRAEELRTESNAPGRASVASPAHEPRRPAKDRRTLGLAAAGFLAIAAGLGAVLLRARRAKG